MTDRRRVPLKLKKITSHWNNIVGTATVIKIQPLLMSFSVLRNKKMALKSTKNAKSGEIN